MGFWGSDHLSGWGKGLCDGGQDREPNQTDKLVDAQAGPVCPVDTRSLTTETFLGKVIYRQQARAARLGFRQCLVMTEAPRVEQGS